MKNRIISFLILIIITGIIGCYHSDNDVTAFFPITEGSKWHFEGRGNEFAEFTQTIAYKSDDQVQFNIVNPGTSSKAVYTVFQDAITRVLLISESYEDENLLETGFEANDNTIIIKGPLKKDNLWKVPGGTREIVEVNANVITPAGNFKDCIKIKCLYEDSNSINYEYYQRNVGLVKIEYIQDEYKVTSTLKEYTIK